MPGMVLLCCFLLMPVAALPAGSQSKVLPLSPPQEFQQPILSPLSCRNLLPESLPGFSHLASLPRYLTSVALYKALEQAGCSKDAHGLRLQLHRLGGIKATETLIQQLQSLREDRRERKSDWVLFSTLRLLSRRNERSGRGPRSLPREDCFYENEQQVHSVVQFLPQVGRYYNLGTAFYYAAQNCSAQAWERGQEAALDLGYDFLMGLSGLVGGPGGLVASAALKPMVKSGLRKLIQYYTNEGSDGPSPGTGQSGREAGRITKEMENSRYEDDHGGAGTTDSYYYRTEEVTEATSQWNWGLFKSWG